MYTSVPSAAKRSAAVNCKEVAMKNLVCPLCGSSGTLRPIRMGRRLRGGPFSFLMLATKTHECKECGARFSTNQLMGEQSTHPEDGPT